MVLTETQEANIKRYLMLQFESVILSRCREYENKTTNIAKYFNKQIVFS